VGRYGDEVLAVPLADASSLDRVDRSVRCQPDAPGDPREALLAFERWPTWMRANGTWTTPWTDYCSTADRARRGSSGRTTGKVWPRFWSTCSPPTRTKPTRTRELRFDIGLLADRLVGILDWLRERPETVALPIGLFGASTGAAAARKSAVGAVVSRGGRPDLADTVAAERAELNRRSDRHRRRRPAPQVTDRTAPPSAWQRGASDQPVLRSRVRHGMVQVCQP
jgi:hypothetical protein